jgi:subtilisin family serine protease
MGAAALPSGTSETSSTGVSIVELQPGANLGQLQAAMGGDPHIEFVSRVPVRYLMTRRRAAGTPAGGGATIAATPPPADTMWNLAKIRWREARDQGLDLAANVSVAVLDTGIDLSHPDLPGAQINFIHDYPDSEATTSDRDIIGHGTHVAGTIRALIGNAVGIDGITECRLSAYKIFGDEPTDQPILVPFPHFPYYVDPILYRAALAACLDEGVQVINLSIGGPGRPDPQERELFQALIDSNVAVVAAMGNENTSRLSYPAAIPGVIAVGATTLDDTRASFSNYGPHIALSAPGVAIWSTLPTYAGQSGFYAVRGDGNTWLRGAPMSRETDYDAWQGTSMATPHVTAAAALAIAKYGAMSAAEAKEKLMAAVDKVPGMSGRDFTKEFGAGRLNLLKL